MRSETSSLTVKMANFETFLIGSSGNWVKDNFRNLKTKTNFAMSKNNCKRFFHKKKNESVLSSSHFRI